MSAQQQSEPTPEWTDEHEQQWQRHLRRLDVETAVFAADTTWQAS